MIAVVTVAAVSVAPTIESSKKLDPRMDCRERLLREVVYPWLVQAVVVQERDWFWQRAVVQARVHSDLLGSPFDGGAKTVATMHGGLVAPR